MPVPLIGRGIANAPQGAVGHAVASQLRRLEIPGKAIQMAVGVAGGAGKLALEAILGGIETSFAPAQSGQFLGSAEIDGCRRLWISRDRRRSGCLPADWLCMPAGRPAKPPRPAGCARLAGASRRTSAAESSRLASSSLGTSLKTPRQPRGVDNRKRVGFRGGHQRVAAVRREGRARFGRRNSSQCRPAPPG